MEVPYSLYIVGQASRRAWRIIQTEPCRTFYPYYSESMEARAVALIGRKQRAAKLLYGDSDIGLSELTGGGDDANDLIAELAKSLDADEDITDLRDLFKAASHADSQRESLWAAEETVAEPPMVITPAAPPIVVENWPQRQSEPVLSALPAKPTPKRRRRVSLSDAPDDLEAPAKHQRSTTPPRALPGQPQQLSLFDL